MLRDHYQVVIIGAGPTGLTLACELLKYKVDFVILEKLQEGADLLAKGIGVSPRMLEIFKQIDPSIVEKVMEFGLEVDTIRMGNYGEVKLAGPFQPDTDPSIPALTVHSQMRTESILANYLKKNGVTIIRGIEVTTVANMGDKVQVEYNPKAGSGSINCRFLVSCDGARSRTRKSLGIKYSGVTKPFTTHVALFTCDPPIEFDTKGKGLLIQEFDPFHGYLLFKLPNNEFVYITNLYTDTEKSYVSEDKDANGFPTPQPISKDQFEEIWKERGLAKHKITSLKWSSHFRINNRLAETFWNGLNIFLAGDSAHSSDPWLGLGQNVGIQDANNLGWKLGLVLNSKLSPSILETYDVERHADGQALMKMCANNDNMLTLSTFVRSIVLYLVFSIKVLADHAMKEAGRLNFQYKSWLSVEGLAGMHDRCGHRFPPFLLSDDCKIYSHAGALPGFKAVIFTKCFQDQLLISKTLAASHSIITECYAANEIMVRRCRVPGDCIMIVRPDFYVGLRSDVFDLDIIGEYFESVGVLPSEFVTIDIDDDTEHSLQ